MLLGAAFWLLVVRDRWGLIERLRVELVQGGRVVQNALPDQELQRDLLLLGVRRDQQLRVLLGEQALGVRGELSS